MTSSIFGRGTPDGHVGFTVFVELDLPLSDLADWQEMTVLRAITEHKP